MPMMAPAPTISRLGSSAKPRLWSRPSPRRPWPGRHRSTAATFGARTGTRLELGDGHDDLPGGGDHGAGQQRLHPRHRLGAMRVHLLERLGRGDAGGEGQPVDHQHLPAKHQRDRHAQQRAAEEPDHQLRPRPRVAIEHGQRGNGGDQAGRRDRRGRRRPGLVDVVLEHRAALWRADGPRSALPRTRRRAAPPAMDMLKPQPIFRPV